MSKKSFWKATAALQLIAFFSFNINAFAAPLLDLEESGGAKGQSEYFNSNRDKRMQIRVNILSGVGKPGIHYIPDNTTLVDFISLAGGVSSNAYPEDISIRRTTGSGIETLNFDLPEIIQNQDIPVPMLANNDIIMIPESSNFRQNLVQNLTLYLLIIGTISTSLALYSTLRK